MKTILTITSLIFAFLIITGCEKGSNSTTNNYFMRATIGADAFSAEGLSKVFQTSSSSGGINFIYITGKADNGPAIRLTFFNNAGNPVSINTFPINSGAVTADYYPKGLDSAVYTNAVSGSVVVTAIRPNIQGSFNFTCANGVEITNGTFSVLAQP